MDWRAVGAGVAAGGAYLLILATFPPFADLRWSAVPVVLGAGLVAGVTAGIDQDDVRRAGVQGLVAGSLVGGGFALSLGAILSRPARPPGVLYALNYLLATTVPHVPYGRTHTELFVGAAAGIAWASIAALGLYGGRVAPVRRRRLADER